MSVAIDVKGEARSEEAPPDRERVGGRASSASWGTRPSLTDSETSMKSGSSGHPRFAGDGEVGRPRARDIAVLGFVGVTLCSWANGADALQCPRPHPDAARAARRDDPQEIARLSSSSRHDQDSALQYTLASLRRGHPGASNGAVLNYSVTAYCPVASSQAGASEAQKRARIRRFAATARVRVYK